MNGYPPSIVQILKQMMMKAVCLPANLSHVHLELLGIYLALFCIDIVIHVEMVN